MSKPSSMMCIYKVKMGKEAEFRALLDKHWATLNRVGLQLDPA
ncbi:hypothetical protein [Archangium sp.]|nr:hypothetical protein [Archangium sp.]HYO57457.1 hypothetical protein [Archangium sp.]